MALIKCPEWGKKFMKKRAIIGMLLFVILMLVCIGSQADEDKRSGLFSYRLKGNGNAVITGFDWKQNGESDVYVPRQVDGYTVTEIGEFAFTKKNAYLDTSNHRNVTTNEKIYGEKVAVVLPDTITSIGERAFFCTKITSINIPESVNIIEGGAFSGCVYLTLLSVSSSNRWFATIDGLLYNKAEKKLVAVPLGKFNPYPYKYGDASTHPGYDIISIPNGIVSIGDYAFYGMRLTGVKNGLAGVELPQSVENIGKSAFEYAIIGRVSNYKIDDEQKYTNTKLSLSNVKVIGEYAFSNATFSKIGLDFPLVEEIQQNAFSNIYCSGQNRDIMDSLVFPETLAYIGESAFSFFRAYPVRTLDLSKTQLTEISKGAFENFAYREHPGFTGDDSFPSDTTINILLPSCLVKIEEEAFYSAYSFFNYYDGGRKNWESYQIKITVPSAVTSIGNSAFSYTSLNISFADDSRLTVIDDNAFSNTRFFNEGKRLEVPLKLQTIGDNAFNVSEEAMIPYALSELCIPDSVNKIGDTVCNRSITSIIASPDSYAALYASENGIPVKPIGGEDTSWLND